MAERALGIALCAAMAAPWLGEGIGWALLVVLVVVLFARSLRARTLAQLRGLFGGPLAAPYIVALVALLVPLVHSALPLHLSGVGRIGPWLAAPWVFVAARVVPPRWVGRAERALLGAALLAVVWGAASMLLGWAPLESYVRLDEATFSQGLVPGQTTRVMGGLFYHRLKMAHALLVALGVALAHAAVPSERRRTQAWFSFVSLTLFCALALTYTRAALLAALGAGALLMLVRARGPARGKPAARALIAVAVVGIALMALPGVRARLGSSSGTEARQVRAVIWRQAVDIVAAHPLGVGLGQYPSYAAAAYARSDPLTLSPRTYPHHALLGLWAEGGPLAALGMMMVWDQLVARAWRVAREPGLAAPRAQRRAACGTLFVLASLFGVGLLHDVFFHQVVAMLALHTLALLAARMSR